MRTSVGRFTWWIGATAAMLALTGTASALPLTLNPEGAHVLGPQSTSNPCIIAATNCPHQPAGMAFNDFVATGSISSYNEFSPTYTVGQLTGLGLTSFDVAIDVNTSRPAGETLQLFDVIVGGSVLYQFLGPSPIGNISNNGNGFADWTLRRIDLTGQSAGTSVQFHAVWDNASGGGESFFLVARAIPGPIAGAGLPGLVLACGGLLAWWRRRTVPITSP